METILSLKNLDKRFGNIHAVNNLSFDIKKGNVYGILGPNGSGKSTTLGIILNVVNKTSGEFSWFDGNLSTHQALKKVGAIIERPNFYPYMTAIQNLKLVCKIKEIPVTKIEEKLKTVNLFERRNSKFKTYSLGMKQRLGIAIALVHNPQLIILDEPTNGLDPQGIADIRKLIQDLAKEGKTILVSSHLLAEIEQVATQILIIHKGKKVVAGSTQALLDPQMKIVQLKTLDDQLALQVLQTNSFNQYLLKRNHGLFLKMPTHEIPKLNASLIAADVPIIGIEAKNSLEDYFLHITSNQ